MIFLQLVATLTFLFRKIILKKIEKKYSNDEITVVWKPDLCSHSTNCWKTLLPVFDPRRKPWVNIQASTTEKIIYAVGKCPSKALSFFNNNEVSESK